MQALNCQYSEYEAGPDAGSAIDSGDRRVLPRFMRKPVRALRRNITTHVVQAPAKFVGVLVVAATVIVGGASYSSDAQNLVRAGLDIIPGYAIHEVAISGNFHLGNGDILNAMEVHKGDSLFMLNVAELRQRLLSSAWIKEANVIKSYPDRLIVEIKEKSPFAIWKKNNHLLLIERGGKPIARYTSRYAHLPQVVGEGANDRAAAMLSLLAQVPALKNRYVALVRVGGRRWDVHLKNGILLRLPEQDVEGALAKLVALDRKTQILSRQVKAVDLRLKDRTIVGLNKDHASVDKATHSGRRI